MREFVIAGLDTEVGVTPEVVGVVPVVGATAAAAAAAAAELGVVAVPMILLYRSPMRRAIWSKVGLLCASNSQHLMMMEL